MNREWEKVERFQLRFGHPVSKSPRSIDAERAKKRYTWMREEVDEFLEAKDDIVEQADAMIDVLYTALGTLVEMGIKPDALFDGAREFGKHLLCATVPAKSKQEGWKLSALIDSSELKKAIYSGNYKTERRGWNPRPTIAQGGGFIETALPACGGCAIGTMNKKELKK